MTELKEISVKAEEAGPNDQPGWDASQYEAALAQLERLENQIRELGSAIPDIMAPLVNVAATRAQMFTQIKKSATNITNNLQAFRNDYTSDRSRDIFAKASQSRQADSDLIRADEIKEQGWISDTNSK